MEIQIQNGEIQIQDLGYKKSRSWILEPGLTSWIRNTVQAVGRFLKINITAGRGGDNLSDTRYTA
jgi:hypothetical protein